MREDPIAGPFQIVIALSQCSLGLLFVESHRLNHHDGFWIAGLFLLHRLLLNFKRNLDHRVVHVLEEPSRRIHCV